MKLIIKEYLQTLREKDELDLLLCDILLMDGFVTHNLPKTGERQYGVDILASKQEEIYLFIVKQQNINRIVWDSNPNSVRQSLNDIHDVYIKSMLPTEWINKKINIVLATNGCMDDAVRISWEGYKTSNSTVNGKQFYYDFWDIDLLTDLVYKHAFNEHLFGKAMQSNLRKVLYYMDESDFNNNYFEKIVDSYISDLTKIKSNQKELKKAMSSIYMCLNLVVQWAVDKEKYKVAISFTEYIIIQYWSFMKVTEGFEKSQYISWLIRFLKIYESVNRKYVKEIHWVSTVPFGIPSYNTLENRLMIFEVIGLLSSFAIYLHTLSYVKESNEVTDILIMLLNNNPGFKYPVYDNNIVELSLMFLLLYLKKRFNDLKALLNIIVQGLECNFNSNHKYPAPNDSFDEAILIETEEKHIPYQASILFGGLIEWACILNEEEIYDKIVSCIKKCFPEITPQSWHLNIDEEDIFYKKNAVYLSGSGFIVDKNKAIGDQLEILKTTYFSDNIDDFSFNKYCFSSIATITNRYYRAPVLIYAWRRFLNIDDGQD